ncbi:MAG: hydantoinase/oxoprolinase family protein, partial [Acidobacteriota bacterium]|nr:hydantoinase/oxoprolinase family protein [Acidobacteriota bacterium]
GRQARPKLYDLFVQKAEPLIPSERRIGAKERLAADGSVVRALNAAEIASVVRSVKKVRPDSVGVCFLFSFRNARHEKQIAAALRASGYLVSVSHEILPEFREYERTATTAINAYLTPVMSGYLRETSERIAELSGDKILSRQLGRGNEQFKLTRVSIMQSNGGIISAEQAAREPVRTILSGPAGGVIGAAHSAKLAGITRGISFDMGGTSTDVALLSGELITTNESIVAGVPVAVPMLEIQTVGAGGGSIARFDQGGALRVGPESAGAIPGPICYGQGTRPTVTDAHAVLGHLGNRGLLGGTFSLDVAHARELMRGRLKTDGRGFRTVEAFAEGIIAVANAVMEKAIRVISVERGHDTRDYTLIAFGGAGPLHACALAGALEMQGVLVPIFPGGLSALGILRADVVKEFSRTVLLRGDQVTESRGLLNKLFAELDAQGIRALREESFARTDMRVEHRLDARYAGQAYDLSVGAEGDFIAAFHQAHDQRYGYHDAGRKVEIVNVRCRATGITVKPATVKAPRRRHGEKLVAAEKLALTFERRPRKTNLFAREDLRAGDAFRGPAVVMEYSATTLIPPDWNARVDAYGQLLLSR